MQQAIGNNQLKLQVGDITKEKVDVIVNAANGSLLGGGGVDGAIHRAAGPELLEACKYVRKSLLHGNELPTGEAVVTEGYQLPATYVIHTVGPIWGHDKDAETLLRNCYQNSLQLALMLKMGGSEIIQEQGGLLSSNDYNMQIEDHRDKRVHIAFPSISTGAYRFPLDLAAKVALTTIIDFLNEHSFGEVSMVLFSEDDLHTYESVLKMLI